MTLTLAVLAGFLIGVSLGALGGGGSILAVPVLVYLLGQNPAEAMTGSLVVVGVTAVIGAVTAHRAGHVLPWRGVTFGLAATGGAVAGAHGSAQVPQPMLLACFSVLLLTVGAFMAVGEIRARRTNASDGHERRRLGSEALGDPIITVRPTFACQCKRAAMVLITATVVGLLMGFFGVGGGFLVVPALMLALAMPIEDAAGTSLVVIAVTSVAALAARQGAGLSPDWNVVVVLTTAAAVGAVLGATLADRVAPRRLRSALTAVVVGVGVYTALEALPALV
ncbi:TSUP family transporter [Aeromicrobium sp.]|uniref:TSUP family transporter n=1 Tax=Aeromicrobium sp. TaxID=1871063 RepID=UPI003C5F4023